MRCASCSSLTDSRPAMTSEWPPMNFVAEVMLMSAPMSKGRWYRNVMMLLSTATRAPASCAASVSLCRSHTCMRGLVGDSSMTSLVLPGLSALRRTLQQACSGHSTGRWQLHSILPNSSSQGRAGLQHACQSALNCLDRRPDSFDWFIV